MNKTYTHTVCGTHTQANKWNGKEFFSSSSSPLIHFSSYFFLQRTTRSVKRTCPLTLKYTHGKCTREVLGKKESKEGKDKMKANVSSTCSILFYFESFCSLTVSLSLSLSFSLSLSLSLRSFRSDFYCTLHKRSYEQVNI